MADIQKYGRTNNLFDKSTATISNLYGADNVYHSIGTSEQVRSVILQCEPNTTYTIQKIVTNRYALWTTTTYPATGGTWYAARSTEATNTTLTFTTEATDHYIILMLSYESSTPSSQDILDSIMYNYGSTPLPYEPYLDWQRSLRKLTTATANIEPTIYTDGTAIASYTIKGNTVQNGAPTPSNPVDVNGVGVRTENLYSGDIKEGGWSATIGSVPTPNASGERLGINEIFVIDNTKTYTIAVFPSTLKVAVMLLDSDNKMIFDTGWSASNYRTISNTYGFVASIKNSSGTAISLSDCEGIVLVEGSSVPTTYEPYGYKIPISNGQQTTNIYLGSTQTVRKIKKLVLTGEEGWEEVAGAIDNPLYFRLPIGANGSIIDEMIISSHYEQIFVSSYNSNNGIGIANSSVANASILKIRDTNTFTDMTTLKAYLAAQYANGTPVTVWYVLTTPETAAVNEPLMKIGDYTDTLSNATAIPTTEGANSITVDTTVQPSEFTATWTGWHDASVKEKSENLFDYETMLDGKTSYFLDASGSEISNPYWSITKYIPVDGTVFTLARTFGGTSPAICLYDSNKNFITGAAYQGEQVVTISSNTNAAYIRFSYYIGEQIEDVAHDMLNLGATALSYEPYWK